MQNTTKLEWLSTGLSVIHWSSLGFGILLYFLKQKIPLCFTLSILLFIFWSILFVGVSWILIIATSFAISSFIYFLVKLLISSLCGSLPLLFLSLSFLCLFSSLYSHITFFVIMLLYNVLMLLNWSFSYFGHYVFVCSTSKISWSKN